MSTFRDYVSEAVMTDAECLEAAKTLVKNGDEKAKEFAQGLIDYYKENDSFHPNQISGLQNIMKNASFQLAKK
jgi:capsule polysaccharide export protein KpsE/RkpR